MYLIARIALLLGIFVSSTVLAQNYRIRDGTHPQISYANLDLIPKNSLRVRYRKKEGFVQEYDDGGRYMMVLPDEVIAKEVLHRFQKNRWTDRVLLEKMYFDLLYGDDGPPASFMADPEKQQRLILPEGWDIFDRKSDYCKWQGIKCGKPGKVTEIRLDSYELQGTLPHDLHGLKDLEHLDLKGKCVLCWLLCHHRLLERPITLTRADFCV
jgi:hypothetical protein